MGDIQVLVYSSNSATRRQVIDSVGRTPDRALPPFAFTEIATAAVLFARLERGGVDLVILDGEAVPAGGLGIARQLTDELSACPPVVVLLGRPTDSWLARWSGAEATVNWPADPTGFSALVLRTLRARAVSLPAG